MSSNVVKIKCSPWEAPAVSTKSRLQYFFDLIKIVNSVIDDNGRLTYQSTGAPKPSQRNFANATRKL